MEGRLQNTPEHEDAPDVRDDAAPLHDTQDGLAAAPESGHLPVLVPQVLEVFADRLAGADGPLTMLDCTLGRGGHAVILSQKLPPGSTYIGLDVDPDNLAYATRRMRDEAPAVTFHALRTNFANAAAALQGLRQTTTLSQDASRPGVDLLLADIGFASNQMDDPSRGFSFAADGPLDMRMDPSSPTTAADLVNSLSEEDLANIIYEYGEERLSRKIARKIGEERARQPILTTSALARVVSQAVGFGQSRGKGGRKAGGKSGGKQVHPATRTFMALRIAVNGELDALRQLLTSLPGLMNPRGVAAIISFHSLEDRMVKQSFASLDEQGAGRRLTRKPLIASDEEIRENPRSRSAKLRALQFK